MKFSERNIPSITLIVLLFVGFSCNDNTSGPGDSSFNTKQGVGDSATYFLRDDTFTQLRVEIDYMPGQEPTQEALDQFQTFLSQRLYKSLISINTPTQIASGGQKSYSDEDIRTLEDQNRNQFPEGPTLTAYVIIVDGQNSAQAGTVGFSYNNSSIALFGQTITELSQRFGAPTKKIIESTALNHEFSHLMGLVGNGTPTQTDHKTQGSPHCTVESCLMQPSIETASFYMSLTDQRVLSLDEQCLQDLQANGGR